MPSACDEIFELERRELRRPKPENVPQDFAKVNLEFLILSKLFGTLALVQVSLTIAYTEKGVILRCGQVEIPSSMPDNFR